MGECIIGRGYGRVGSGSGGGILTVELIESNKTWVVPAAKNQEFSVRIFGGGGGGIYNDSNTKNQFGAGGGGGYMNFNVIRLTQGQSIAITIGSGSYSTGGTTSFGTYLSANGGRPGNLNRFYSEYHSSYITLLYGGNGGSGGGGEIGGHGFQFGAGGGSDWNIGTSIIYSGYGGKYYGNYGGNRGSDGTALPLDETNNSSLNYYSGKTINKYYNSYNMDKGVNKTTIENTHYGGGGGYGANGGNAVYISELYSGIDMIRGVGQGVGGGYGKYGKGGDGYAGGYRNNARNNIGYGGGGGSYGPGGSYNSVYAKWGGGGAGAPGYEYGGSGLCIISYYK